MAWTRKENTLAEYSYGEAGGGQELGNIMDELQGMENTKQRWGAIGFFTRGHFNRQESFEQDVLFALVRFLRGELYP